MRLKKVILKRFCGFNDFEIDIGDFTVLVGPNNGGKTTILRAVKFGLDAVRIGFGDQGDPNYGAWTQPIHHIPLDPVARRLGLVQVDQLYHGRDQREAASVSLLFERGGGEVRVEAVCERADASIALRVTRGSKLLQRPLDEDAHDLIDELYRMRLEFVPPPGAISSDEHELDWHQLKAKLAQGQFAGTWRNRLHWMNEGGDPELFRCLVDRVREYMPGVGIRPPRRSKITSSVEANYVENGIEHDIFAGGDGLRTLITVVAPIELSDAQILLFDEPDSHLHSSAQRRIAALLEDAASEDRQILVATHAPDFIEAVGLESLVWVDRSKSNAQRCDEVGKVLVDLGAIGHTQALQHIGADAVVYVEGKADGHVFSGIFDRAGKGDWVHRCRLAKLGGYGDKDKLPFL